MTNAHISLAELAERLPLSRASVFEVIKALGITTAKGPGPGGRGRVAWVSSADADRIAEACRRVDAGEVRIADLALPLRREAAGNTVLGLDLSKVGLGQALEAMAEAWLEAQGVEPAGEAIAAPAVAASIPASKRSDWITRAWYVAPDTAKGLKAYVNRAQEAGQKLDASEVVNEAVRRWLEARA